MSALLRCLALFAVCAALHWVHTDQLPLPLSQKHVIHFWSKWLVTLCALIAANSALSSWAENKWLWQSDANAWDLKREIAVITGGAQGIGAHVVKRLVSYGVTCAVLDIAPMSDYFTKGTCFFNHATWLRTTRRTRICSTLSMRPNFVGRHTPCRRSNPL
jgi:hypothetical protein